MKLAIVVSCALAAASSVHAREKREAGESIVGRGIFPGKELLLFADVRRCDREPALPAAQIFVSTDAGVTWAKRGPPLEGSSFEYVRADADGIWLVGAHSAEGPLLAPFLLVPIGGELRWRRRLIYGGPAELRGVARTGDKAFVVWVRHIDVSDDRWPGPIYIHTSTDGGKTWRVTGPADGPAPGTPGLFERISRSAGDWRLVDRDDGGFDVERRSRDGWQTTATFPWKLCGR